MKSALFVLPPLLIAFAAVPESPEEPSEKEKEAIQSIAAVIDRYEKACDAEDMEAVSQLFSHDEDTVLIHATAGGMTVGWKKIKVGYEFFFANASEIDFEHKLGKIKVSSSGTAAWATWEQGATFEFRGQTREFPGVRVTWGLEKQDGKWRIVQAHWSVPQRSAAEERQSSSSSEAATE